MTRERFEGSQMTRQVIAAALWWMLAGCVLVGCKRAEAPTEQAPSTAEPAPSAEPAPTAEPVEELPSADALAVPDDFENEAAAEITAETYRAQLDVIEKEFEAELAVDAPK